LAQCIPRLLASNMTS